MEMIRLAPSERISEAIGSWKGSRPSHEIDYQGLRVNRAYQVLLAEAYRSAPMVVESDRHYWEAMAEETEAQYAHLSQYVTMKVTEGDPYNGGDIRLMMADLEATGTLEIYATKPGDHPIWSPDLNDKFRFVHDCFGHLATGNGTDRHGEYGAFIHHLQMFSNWSLPAVVTELQAQNAYQIVFGDFGPQKVVDLGLRRDDYK